MEEDSWFNESSGFEAKESENVNPVRKRTSEVSTLTPQARKVGIPLIKRSSMSVLADGFRTATSLANEGTDENDSFGLSFRHENSKIIGISTPKPTTPKTYSNIRALSDKDLETYSSIKKLKNFYEWQKECLADKRLLDGQNCILSLPTGAGKTLIAEILMIREAVEKRRSALLVLPYVAIVQEKISSLAPFEEAFGINIEEYASNKGRFPPIKRRKKISVYVATIEKANMLINSMISENKLADLGLVVIDELHMIGERGRGAIIEQVIAKYLYKGSGQIVGMSATLPNLDELQLSMRAFVYSTKFRPVALTEYVKIGQTMYQVEDDGGLKPSGDLQPNNREDPDGICLLIANLVPKNSAVIFCPNKKNCENVAVLLVKSIPPEIRRQKRKEREIFLQSVYSDDEDEKMDRLLRDCLLSGVAYHHSGLTQDERKYVEAAFMEGLIFVVCATSTLAAGVNLPARRVIIKAPMVGRDRLGKAQYLQMAGRAGRAGFDTKGDCITIVRPGEEERWFRKMLTSELPKCISALSCEETMESFLLDLLSLKIASNSDELLVAVRYSLLAAQKSQDDIREMVENCLKILIDKKLVEKDKENLTASDLGKAVFVAGFAPEEATRLYSDLRTSLNQGVIFSSHFHLLFIITPYDQACNINWDLFLMLYNALPISEKNLLDRCGLSEKYILDAIIKRVEQVPGSPRMRLYIAMMLQKIWDHESLSAVADRFGVEKGWLQSTLQSSISQAASIAKFSEKIASLWPLRQLLPELVQKLSEASQPELLPLMAIEGIKKGRAAVLFNSGFKTVASVARADERKLMEVLGKIRIQHARNIISSAKIILRDRIDEKIEELDVWGMVNVKKGVFVTSDPAFRQLLIHLDESRQLGSKFIIRELDETHLFIEKEVLPTLEEKIESIMENMNPELSER
ncbi:unnamed protein product [Caenorhabditis bovis]|uniref:Helicase POLQ-like n=1 Tax=Caenorhabditis bovis TaxID=2654633 RepID=A0A8S1EPA5_9PELO|nr:unnamed protein product [Caenorhabditis bovis]